MEILNPDCNLNSFFESLRCAGHRALLLDYDGTLAPFQVDREQALPYPGVKRLLSRLVANANTRTVVISGRPVEDVKRLLQLERLPEIWGSHGLERLIGGSEYEAIDLSPAAQTGLKAAQIWIEKEHLSQFAERKPSGFAFHWRGKSKEEAIRLRRKIEQKWLSEASRFGLIVREFDGGLELRPAGITKGDAVRRIVSELGSGAPLAYLGDDLTDEDAFRALEGRGLRVLVRSELRETAADIWIKPPEELLEFLGRWLESGG
ncbi:MAG: trehalose-phosphatase [Candidatus Zixiibacteriota bacterium]